MNKKQLYDNSGSGSYASSVSVFGGIRAERSYQDEKWGEQDHPSIDGGTDGTGKAEIYGLPTEWDIKQSLAPLAKRGALTWADIAIEELVEAIEAKDESMRRGELVQLAAVVVAWIENIDRRVS